jgi:hypothetical protein
MTPPHVMHHIVLIHFVFCQYVDRMIPNERSNVPLNDQRRSHVLVGVSNQRDELSPMNWMQYPISCATDTGSVGPNFQKAVDT